LDQLLDSVSGTMGIVVTESGKERIYRFPSIHSGFYSAAQEDGDTLWLCGDLSRVVRLTLSTGEIECCETGAPSALVFQGMALDQATGKLFAAAFPPPSTVAFSFDYRNRRPVKQYSPSMSGALYAGVICERRRHVQHRDRQPGRHAAAVRPAEGND
jgi:hypothetical protein